jgi:hypothetical protein
LKQASAGQSDADEERLREAADQIADAHRFLTDTLTTLQAHGSETLSDTESAAEGGAMEAIEAVVTAAVDAALAAMTTVDEILFGHTSSPAASSAESVPGHSSESSATANTSSEACPQEGLKTATKMDHAQVFLSKSMFALRTQASGLIRGNCADPRIAVPSKVSTSVSSTANTTEGRSDVPEVSMSSESANATGATAADGYEQPAATEAEDAFLLVPDSPAETTPAEMNGDRRA